ncbi:helix-turn-helix domain-containing protein [Bradyrhizobium sp. UFLA05-112]
MMELKNCAPKLISDLSPVTADVRYRTREPARVRIDGSRWHSNSHPDELIGWPMRRNQRQRNGGGQLIEGLSASKPSDPRKIPFAERLTCTIDEACQATGLGRTKLYELIGAGQLDTRTVGRRRLVLVRSLRSMLNASCSKADGIEDAS